MAAGGGCTIGTPWPSAWPTRIVSPVAGGGRLDRLRLEGGDVVPRLRDTGFEGLDTARHPQEAFQHRLARAGGLGGRPIDGPLPQQVGIAARGQAQLRVKGAEALMSWGGEGMPLKAHFAKNRIVGCPALIVIGQARPIRGGDRLRRAHSGTCDKEQPQQRRAQGQQPPEQGQLHGIGRLRPGFRARDVGQQVLKLVVQLLYNRLWVGSHRGSPLANRLVRLPMIAQGAMAFNSLRSPNVYPYYVPQILVTLK